MKLIDNERIAFYYDHHEDIQKWASIRDDIPAIINDFLLSLSPRIQDVANEVDAYPYLLDLDNKHPKLLLARREWASAEKAKIGIGVEWQKGKVDLLQTFPYVGVWVDKRLDTSGLRYTALSDGLAPIRRDISYKPGGSGGWWPAWVSVPPDHGERFWEDLEPYAAKLIEEIRRAWWAFAEEIDDVLDSQPR